MMTLTDVYCRVNRARGLELLSPEDLLHASRRLAPLGLPIVLRSFDSGVMVLQIRSHDDNAVVDRITELVNIHAKKMKIFNLLYLIHIKLSVEGKGIYDGRRSCTIGGHIGIVSARAITSHRKARESV